MAQIEEIKHIPLENLEIGKSQVRLRDVGKDIDELADSIRKVGLLEPIVVCESETPGKYEVITGQRRFLAHVELREPTILAVILDQRVDESTAKVLSVTENLVRRDLNTRDLIDVCTDLFRKYGSISAVCEETGLPRAKVTRYVKYEQLIPELQELVSASEVKMETALRAQHAAGVTGAVNAADAVELAKEMSSMSGAQQKRIIKEREDDPERPVDEVIEHAKTGGKITQIMVTLTSATHRSLSAYAEIEGSTLDDAASTLIETSLSDRGLLED